MGDSSSDDSDIAVRLQRLELRIHLLHRVCGQLATQLEDVIDNDTTHLKSMMKRYAHGTVPLIEAVELLHKDSAAAAASRSQQDGNPPTC